MLIIAAYNHISLLIESLQDRPLLHNDKSRRGTRLCARNTKSQMGTVFNQLCHICESVCYSAEWNAETMIESNHHDIVSLQASASKKCHFCLLLWQAVVNHGSRNIDRLRSELTQDQSQSKRESQIIITIRPHDHEKGYLRFYLRLRAFLDDPQSRSQIAGLWLLLPDGLFTLSGSLYL